MNRHSFYIFAALALGFAALTGCKDAEEEKPTVDLSTVTLTLTTDSNPVREADGTVLYNYVWNEDDAVSAFFGYTNGITFSTTASGTPSGRFITISKGTYTPDSEVDLFFKVHAPKSDVSTSYNQTLSATFPNTTESCTKDDWTIKPIMVGASTTETISLHGVASFLRFHVTGADINRISILSNDSSKKLSGKVYFMFDSAGKPILSDDSLASNVVTCTPPEGESSFKPGVNYYVPVIPADLTARGYTIIYYSEEGNKQITVAKASAAFEINTAYNIPQTDEDAEPAEISGNFSTSPAGNLVTFALGNLQYDLEKKTWGIAENQYDFIGKAEGNLNPAGDSGKIDLFAWSTDAANSNWGISTITEPTDGYTSGSFKDWSANMSRDGWKTPLKEEMSFILSQREASTINGTANARFAKATVNGICGLLLFPDVFVWPESVTAPSKINDTGCKFSTNEYTVGQFEILEKRGIVFLPAAGNRVGTNVSYTGDAGYYWTGSECSPTGAYGLWFSLEGVASGNTLKRSDACAVRLISPVGSI